MFPPRSKTKGKGFLGSSSQSSNTDSSVNSCLVGKGNGPGVARGTIVHPQMQSFSPQPQSPYDYDQAKAAVNAVVVRVVGVFGGIRRKAEKGLQILLILG